MLKATLLDFMDSKQILYSTVMVNNIWIVIWSVSETLRSSIYLLFLFVEKAEAITFLAYPGYWISLVLIKCTLRIPGLSKGMFKRNQWHVKLWSVWVYFTSLGTCQSEELSFLKFTILRKHKLISLWIFVHGNGCFFCWVMYCSKIKSLPSRPKWP